MGGKASSKVKHEYFEEVTFVTILNRVNGHHVPGNLLFFYQQLD